MSKGDRMGLRVVTALVGALSAGSLYAGVWYVDASAAAGGTGSAEAPFKTIQTAIDAGTTVAGDTILVAPGIYAEGGTVDAGGHTNRVYVTKSLTIRSTGGRATRDVTEIVGRHGTATAGGLGNDAIRCVAVNAPNVVIEGFTLRDGGTKDGGDLPSTSGGGLYFFNSTGNYAVDCAILNCAATRGGGVRNGAGLVRCLLAGNYCSGNGAAARDAALYWCVVTGCRQLPLYGSKDVVGCTFAINYVNDLNDGGTRDYYNTAIFTANLLGLANRLHHCVTTVTANSISNAPADSVVGVGTYQLVAPAFADYRLLATSDARGVGTTNWLAKIPVAYRYQDYTGAEIVPTAAGAIHAGAVQACVTPEGGRLLLNHENFLVNGVKAGASTYAYAATWPTQFQFGVSLASGSHLYGLTASDADGMSRFPLRDGTFTVIPPPAGSSLTLVPMTTTRAYWVDAAAEGTTTPTGTEGDPFRAIQDAVNKVGVSDCAVIYVKPGTYAVGETYGLGLSNRVWISQGNIRIVSTDGPTVTVIAGAQDPNSVAPYGVGPAAVRCVAVGNNREAAVQGFTLAGGRVDAGGSDADNVRGGGFFGGASGMNLASPAQLLDCIVTNCVASRGAIAGGYAARCRVLGSVAKDNGLVRWMNTASCLFADNTAVTIFAEEGTNFHATVIGKNNNQVVNGKVSMANCIFSGFGRTGACTFFSGGVIWNTPVLDFTGGYIYADPQFLNVAGGDYRLYGTSPAIGAGAVTADKYYRFASADVNGMPLLFRNGKPVAGCFSETVAAVIASAVGSAAGSAGISPAGTNTAVTVGTTITFTATDAATRTFLGFEVNGVTQLVSGVTYDYTVVEGEGLIIRALYSTDWYVDPVAGSNANSGADWSHAKATLANIFTNTAITAGDTVHAAPGVYDNGMMLHKVPVKGTVITIPSRVVVPAGVALVSRDGADSTFIVGAAPSSPDGWQLGADAVRGVFLEPNSRLAGFTVTGGHTASQGSDQDDVRAGGVYCRNGTPLVTDCVISNNYSTRGGGVFDGTYVRCRIIGNHASGNGSAGRGGDTPYLYLYCCYFDGNLGASLFYNFAAMTGCTIGPSNGNVGVSGYIDFSTSGTIKDSLLLSVGTSANNMTLVGCAYLNTAVWGPSSTFTGCISGGVGDFAIDASGAPVVGANLAIDAGNATLWPTNVCGMTDLARNQRIMNGRMDIGAFEADWRPRYAADLAVRDLVVHAVAEQPYELSRSSVALPAGWLELDWARGEMNTDIYRFQVQVTGTGVLTVLQDGNAFGSYTAADGILPVSFVTAAASTRLRFTYTPGANDTGYAVLSDFNHSAGTLFFLR